MTDRNWRLSYTFQTLVKICQPPLIAEVVLFVPNAECVCFMLDQERTSETAIGGVERVTFATPALTFQ